eukprot:COSAG01_NODE_12020_length_1815_cov_2.556527_1_plen_359_part_00
MLVHKMPYLQCTARRACTAQLHRMPSLRTLPAPLLLLRSTPPCNAPAAVPALRAGICSIHRVPAVPVRYSSSSGGGTNPIEQFIGLGHAAMERGDAAAAQEQFSLAIVAAPQLPTGYCFRGECRAALGEYERAADDFAKAVELAPTLVVAHRFLAECLCAAGQLAQAEAAYDRAVQVADAEAAAAGAGAINVDMHMARAAMLGRVGQSGQAALAFGRVVEAAAAEPPGCVGALSLREAWLGKARACLAAGQADAAVEAFKQSVAPLSAEEEEEEAALAEEGSEALAEWRGRGRLEALAALGALAMRGGRAHEAVLHYTQAVEGCQAVLDRNAVTAMPEGLGYDEEEGEELHSTLRALR